MLARRGKRPKNHYFLHSWSSFIQIQHISSENGIPKTFFHILVHPNAHACFPNTKINTTRKYTNTKYIGLEIIPKCYQILGPIGKNIMHILTGCPWNHFFGCQSLKERFFRDTLYYEYKQECPLLWIKKRCHYYDAQENLGCTLGDWYENFDFHDYSTYLWK